VLSSNDTLVSHLFLYPGIDMNVIPAFWNTSSKCQQNWSL
jgi:hypothetical protein